MTSNLDSSDWALALRLLLTPGLGAQSMRKLWLLCGTLPAIWAQPFDTLVQALGEPLAARRWAGTRRIPGRVGCSGDAPPPAQS